MTTDIDTLATALHVRTDDLLRAQPWLAPWRPKVGIEAGVELLRPARKNEPERPGARLFKPLRQTIESINQTFKGQLDLERHCGRAPAGVIVRVLQRVLALTAAIWHNDKIGQTVMWSLTAYDH